MINKFVLLIIVFISISGCARQQESKYNETRTLMGTIVSLDVCMGAQSQEKIAKAYHEVWDRLEEISWRMYVMNAQSDVAKVNRSFPGAVKIQADTYQVIKAAIHFSDITGGAFDITVWPLIKLWKDSAKNNRLPLEQEVKDVLGQIGTHHIQLLSNNQVQLLHESASIDLGGIAKGYAVDEAARIFRAHGFSNFFIDAGGDLYVGGQSCQGNPWRIGVRDPRDHVGIIDIITLTNSAVTTSGDYERYFEIQNQRWSHIINPVTGYPQKDVVSATVIAPTAQEADALSTALSVLGSREGIAFMNDLDENHAGLIIVKQGQGELEYFSSWQYQKKFQVKK